MTPDSGTRGQAPRSLLYILCDGAPVPCADALEWGMWMDRASRDGSRRVALDELGDGLAVSTVFLGLDHNHLDSDGPPILYETLVFYAWGEGTGATGTMLRYATRDEAAAGHARVVAEVRAELDESQLLADDVVAEIIVRVRNRL